VNVLVVGHAPIHDANRDVYRALAAGNINVALLVPDRWKGIFGTVTVEPGGGVEVVARPIRGRCHSNMYWFAGGVRRVAERCRADVIYVDEDPAGFAAAQAAYAAERLRIGLVVLAVQNIYKRYPPPFGPIQRRVLGQAGAAVTNSHEATATLQRRGYRGPVFEKPLTTDVTPLSAVRRNEVRARHGMRASTFGYVGRLVPEKGIDVFLRALAEVGEARALVAGDGPQRRNLEALAGRLRIADRVRFLGSLPPREAVELIGSLDALVLPSLTTRSWSEQFGRVLVEAMATGVPVIASRSGAIPQTIGDAGLLVTEGRPKELALAMGRVCDPATARDLARRGLERAARHFTPRVVAASLERAFRSAAPAAAR
jgi:glycosyltransferase involved in cell wall biosynthesis